MFIPALTFLPVVILSLFYLDNYRLSPGHFFHSKSIGIIVTLRNPSTICYLLYTWQIGLSKTQQIGILKIESHLPSVIYYTILLGG
jgi:hypothetical protein